MPNNIDSSQVEWATEQAKAFADAFKSAKTSLPDLTLTEFFNWPGVEISDWKEAYQKYHVFRKRYLAITANSGKGSPGVEYILTYGSPKVLLGQKIHLAHMGIMSSFSKNGKPARSAQAKRAAKRQKSGGVDTRLLKAYVRIAQVGVIIPSDGVVAHLLSVRPAEVEKVRKALVEKGYMLIKTPAGGYLVDALPPEPAPEPAPAPAPAPPVWAIINQAWRSPEFEGEIRRIAYAEATRAIYDLFGWPKSENGGSENDDG